MKLQTGIKNVTNRITYLREILFGMKPVPSKLKLIEIAFEKNKNRSFADLGGVWGVNGAYSFHLLYKYQVSKAFIVDNHFTEKVKKRSARYPQLRLMKGDFRIRETFDRIGEVDLILLFDVLLHQVNWQEVLSLCTEKAHNIAVYNPQFSGEKSVRLLDLGEEAYFNLVPHRKKDPYYEDLFTPHEQRDSTGVWQWGISDKDLISTLNQLDFRLSYSVDGEYWPNPAFRSKGFLFQKAK